MTTNLRYSVAIASCFWALVCSAMAEIKLPAIFGDHMVLQQSTVVPVWGWAAPGEKIKVTVGSTTGTGTADAQGKWMVKLNGLKASATPTKMILSGASQTVEINDVLIGDVWLCSGQSNMAVPLSGASNGKEELDKANEAGLRLFYVKNQTAAQPQDDCTGKWQLCSPDSAKGFSAVGYFFGKEITQQQKIPVGMIESAQGSSAGQLWASLETLMADPELKKTYIDPVLSLINDPKAAKAAHDEWLAKGGEKYRAARSKCYQDRYQAQQKGLPLPAMPTPPSPEPMYFDNSTEFPTVLYNAMIHPLMPFAIKGAVWYQGESNARDSVLYRKLLPALIQNWRKQWEQGDFPFLIVQLPNYRTRSPQPADGGWAVIRESQLMTLKSSPNTGIAITIDLGEENNLHPPFKSEVGHRLALLARANVYGEKIVAMSPLYESSRVDGNKVRMKFSNVGKGLKIGMPPKGSLTPPPSSTEIKGFAIAGADNKFVWAKATIEGTDTVVVSSPDVSAPTAVRYGWDNNPEVNLYNSADLPASPFRCDVASNAH